MERKEKLKLAVEKSWDLSIALPVSLIHKYFPEAEVELHNQEDPFQYFCFGKVFIDGEYLGSGFIFDYNGISQKSRNKIGN